MSRLRVWIAILTILIISFSSFSLLNSSFYDIEEPIVLDVDKDTEHNLVTLVKTRAARDVWSDNFEKDILIEEMKDVKMIENTIELAERSFNLSSSLDFDAGIKTGTVTETDEYQVPPGQIRIESPYYKKDPSLLLFYPMNEGSGNNANDETNNNNDGSISGASWTTGKFQNGLDFDGSNDYIGIGGISNIHKPITIEAWINPDSTSASQTIFGKNALINFGYHYENTFFLDPPGTLRLLDRNPPSGFQVKSTKVLYPNTWYHVGVTRDVSNNVIIYTNGTSAGSGNLGGDRILSTTNYLIGKVNSDHYPYNGVIDEMKVYNRVLSPSEILTQYNFGKLYNTSGIWESAPVELYNNYSVSDFSIEYSNVLLEKSYIDRIEWLENGTIKACYEIDIYDSSKSPFTIINSDLTSGSFQNIANNFTIKLYLKGDGNHTPIITKLHSNLQYLKGYIISKQIALNQNYRWDALTHSKAINPNTNIHISILDGITNEFIKNFKGMNETYINLSTLDSMKHSVIKLRADFNGSIEFSPKLNQWSVSWIEDYPVLDPEIPSNYTLQEDSNAKHLIALGDYFYDYYDSLENLTFKITYQSNKKHIEAKVKDGQYLSFFTKMKDWTGSERFKVSCTDSGGLKIVSNKFDVTVTPVDDPPIWIKNLPDLKTDEDTKTENWLDLDNYVSDAEEDYLDFTVINLSDPSNITITINSENKITIIPGLDFYGTITATIQVFEGDNESLYANDTFDIIVYPTNDPPTIPEIPDQTVKEDQWLNFTITAIDKDQDETFNFFSNISKNNFKLDPSSGNLSFHPTNDDVGILFVNITVEDIEHMKGFGQFKITIRNKNDPPDDPAIKSPKNEDIFKINDQIEFVAEACFDIDKEDVINYSWDFDLSNGIGKDRIGQEVNYTFKSTGRYIVTLTVTDGTIQKSTSIVVNITSSGVPIGPNGPVDETSKKSDDLSAWLISVVVIIIIILVIVVFLVMRNRKKSILKEYLKEIEQAYDWARTNPAIGKEKLTNLRLRLSNDLKNGVLSKEDYSILENKLNDYMNILGIQKPIGVIPSAIPAGRPVSILPSVTPTPTPTSQPTPTPTPQIAPAQPKPTPRLPAHTPIPTPTPVPTPSQIQPLVPIPVPKPKVEPIQPAPSTTTIPAQTTATKKEVVKCFNCGNLVTVTKTSEDGPTILHCPKCGTEGTI